MTKRSELFLQNITQIDYASLDMNGDGRPIGGSLHLSARVSGEVDSHEQVVVDFSKIKKSIKAIIDDQWEGFDHKLWVPADYQIYENSLTVDEDGGECHIQTETFDYMCPTNAIKFISLDIMSMDSAIIDIKNQLEYKLNEIYPNVKIKVVIELDNFPFLPSSINSSFHCFRYVHGLKNSSSWGCQNMNHGHLSWFGVLNKEGKNVQLPNELLKEIKHTIQNCIFIWEENIVQRNHDSITIQYTTERGFFQTTYKNLNDHIIVTEEETTVENLGSWFIDRFGKQLTNRSLIGQEVSQIYFSEGLAKGCFLEL